MVSVSQEATIKYKVDSTQAVQATKQLSRAQNVMASQTAPALSSSFATLGGQVTDLTGVSNNLGFSLSSGLGPAFGFLGNALAAVNPLVLGLTVAAAGLAAVWLASKNDLEKLTEALEDHESALLDVIKAGGEFADISRDLIGLSRDKIEAERAEIEQQLRIVRMTIDRIERGEELISLDDAIKTGLLEVWAADKLFGDSIEETQAKAAGLIAELAALDERLAGLSETSGSAAADLLKVREQILRLQESIEGDALTTEKLDEFYLARAAIIEEAAAVEIEKADDNAALITLIEEKKNLQLTALFQDYAMARSELETDYTITVERTAAQALQTWANTFKARETLSKRAERTQANFLKSSQKAFAEAQAGRISIAQAGAKAVLGFVAEEVAQELELRAKLWAAQAIAAAASLNFSSAALYAAAAAAAVGAAGFVRGAAESAFADESSQNQPEETELAGSPGAEGTRRGTTVVSEGPLTLNYSATQVINGNVFGTEDLFDLWQSWNEDQIRAAAGEARERTRA